MGILEERQFFAGENSDYEDRKMEPGDYRFGLNIEVDSVDGANQGIVVNSKGNRLVSVTLPSGTNECIGQGEDDHDAFTYYFIYNSNSNHSIYRFNHLTEVIELVMLNPMFNFSVDHRVNSVDIVDDKLLYFNDGFNPPRKINVNKAVENGKLRKFNIYFGDKPQNGETYTIDVQFNGVSIGFWTYIASVVPNGSAYDLAHNLASSAPPSALVLASYTSCGASVEIEFQNPGEYDLVVTCTAPDQVIVTAENFYPKPYPEDFIDRLKYPLECEPTVELKADLTKDQNLIQGTVFQFAIQYLYDDKEKSAISPYSTIPTTADYCGVVPRSSLLNYIEVDFTNARLNDPIRRSLIKGINIIYREHNTGELKISETLSPDQFGINRNTYRFYNNSTNTAVAQNEANKLFDSLPIIAGTSDVIASRIFDADILEGYDPTCIDADLSIKYIDNRGTVNLSGILSIIQIDGTGTVQPTRQPIWADAGNPNTRGWGLTHKSWQHPNTSSTDRPFLGSDPNPHKASYGGFVGYLAGTDYYAVTRQRNIIDSVTGVLVSIQNPTTGLVSWSNSGQWSVMNHIANSDPRYSSSFVNDWSIQGVKPGVYSLRVASTDLDPNSLIDPSRVYQRTSTPIHFDPIFGSQGGVCDSGTTEAIIEVLATGVVNVRNPDTYAIISTSNNGYTGETFIRDYTQSDWLMHSLGGAVYILDGGGDPVPTIPDTMLSYPGVSKMVVRAQYIISGYPDQFSTRKTDHNGFVVLDSTLYYNNAGLTPVYDSHLIEIEVLPNLTSAAFTLYRAINPIGLTVTNLEWNSTGYISCAKSLSYYYHPSATLRVDSRSFITGTIIDSFGSPAQNVNVALTNHQSTSTNSQGYFQIPYYSTSYTAGYLAPESDNLLISPMGLCAVTITNPVTLVTPIIGPGNYTETNLYVAGQYVVSFITREFSALKRGYEGSLGIVYYDRGNRSSSVNTNEKLELHVPFYTETDPATGQLFPSHAPSVEWSIKSIPPDWATHYQWVRTKNYQLSFYLQFTANVVEYVNTPSESAAVVGYTTGRYARIDISNILLYKDQYPNSLIGYTWTKGDRIRFIAGPGNVFYQNYYDYEILYYDESATKSYIYIYADTYIGEIKNGTLFEIYTPKLGTNQKIYYEIGECYEVGENGAGNKYHKGPDQDQDPLNPFNTPAKGVFKTGDAWYRPRSIPYNNLGLTVGQIYQIDSASVSDFYFSEDDNIGRPNIYDPNLKQIRREKSIRFSDVYLEDTQINGLSSNAALNVETIEKGEGPVYKLIRAGNVLIAIQGSQCNSLYVNEIIYIDANANPSLTASSKVIGTIRPLMGDFGTINPESVREYEGNVYFWDQLGGNVIRYKQDGLNPINYFKMRAFFGNKAREMAALPKEETYAIGGFDPLNKRYLLTFKKNRTNSTFTEITKVFNELSNRWTSSQSFIAECYAMTSMSVITFKAGELWVHDSPVKNNFYNQQYNSQIGAIFNQESGKVRNFIALSQESDGVWSVPVIEVPKNANAPTGMLSRLIESKFVKKEGVWYAAIMKDMNSPNFPTQTDALISGRSMRGHVLTMTLENNQLDQVRLNAINLKYIHSEPSKK